MYSLKYCSCQRKHRSRNHTKRKLIYGLERMNKYKKSMSQKQNKNDSKK